jgi:hypothetical protein
MTTRERYPEYDHDGYEVHICKSTWYDGYLVSKAIGNMGTRWFLSKDLEWVLWAAGEDGDHVHHYNIYDAIFAAELVTSERRAQEELEWNDHDN